MSSDEFERGYVAMLYMMNKRGEVLRDSVPPEHAQRSRPLIDGLCDPDRQVRSRWLARSLRDILSELQARELN